MSTQIPVISSAQLSSQFALRPNNLAWFLGAGASAASGIPTGYAMITDFKAQIYCRENNLARREIDTGDTIWINRINDFFLQRSLLPPNGDPTEYAAAFEAVYPNQALRRQYIENAISMGAPSFGHRVLGSLIAARKVDCIFTTNFDPLIEESSQDANALLPPHEKSRLTVAAIDSAARAMRCFKESSWPLVAKLHGDYQSEGIKNTELELEKQDERMRQVLIEASRRFGMVFIGYSGRDASVMEVLNSVLRENAPFPNGLYWVAPSFNHLIPNVVKFLNSAILAGVNVSLVDCKTFDELAGDIIKCVDMPQVLLNHAMQGRPAPRLVQINVPDKEARQFPVLRYSALLVDSLPRVARRLLLEQPTTSKVVRELLKKHKCKAIVAANGRELAVFGRDNDILAALNSLTPKLAGTLELDPTSDSWALGLLYDGLVKSLSRFRPLIPRFSRSGHSLIVSPPRNGEHHDKTLKRDKLRIAYGGALTGKVPKFDAQFQEGVFVKLEQINGRWWCGFEPFTFIEFSKKEILENRGPAEAIILEQNGSELLSGRRRADPAGDWRRERWAQKYNKQWAAIIDAWATLLTSNNDEKMRSFGLEEHAGIDAEFSISKLTGWSRPSHHHPYFDRTK